MTESNSSTSDKLSQENSPKESKISNEAQVEINSNSATNTKLNLMENSSSNESNKDYKQDLFNVALQELKVKRIDLEKEIASLEQRKNQIKEELSVSFLGQSDSMARRVKGFQDYLTGALQNLSQSVEQLDLIAQPVVVTPSPLDQANNQKDDSAHDEKLESVSAIADTFKPDRELILQLLGQYLEGPDYYADPWKFRRSLETNDTETLEDWFFNMGGRGAQPSRGNRSRNILLSAALISILGEI